MSTPTAVIDLVRVALGIIYAIGAIAHFYLLATTPEVYNMFAEMAVVGFYADLWSAVVLPALWMLVPLVILFEICVALAMVWRGRVVQIGHYAACLFQLGLVLSGPWWIINLGFAVLHLYLARREYPHHVLGHSRRGR